ncbi:MAG: hypothetical protein QM695_03810 [Micropruina sp.]
MSTPPSGSPGPEFDPPASFPAGRAAPEPDGAAAPSAAPAAGQPSRTSGDSYSGCQASETPYPAGAPGYPAGGTHYSPGSAQYPNAASPDPTAGQYPNPAALYPGAGGQPPNPGAPVPGDGYPGVPGAPQPTGYQAPGGGFPLAVPPAAPERVGLGLLAAAVVVLVCCALTAALYHWGFIASITAWLMAIGAAWAYGRFGGAPVKGRVPLLVLIVVGIVLGFLSMVANAVWDYYWDEMGSAGTTSEAVELVLGNLFNSELWQDLGGDALFYFLFAALGAFGVLRRMSGIGKAKA